MSERCNYCGGEGILKQGWTHAMYCSYDCELRAVSRVVTSSGGRVKGQPNWVPHNVGDEISKRWEEDEA